MVPIHYAVLRNNYEMVQFLLEHKADEIVIGIYK
jgi:ankyrin repeat protein